MPQTLHWTYGYEESAVGGSSASKLLAGHVNNGPSMSVMHLLCSVCALQVSPEATWPQAKIGTSLQPGHGRAVVVELDELVIVLVVWVSVIELLVTVVVVDVCTV
jgi:hypothetical protein